LGGEAGRGGKTSKKKRRVVSESGTFCWVIIVNSSNNSITALFLLFYFSIMVVYNTESAFFFLSFAALFLYIYISGTRTFLLGCAAGAAREIFWDEIFFYFSTLFKNPSRRCCASSSCVSFQVQQFFSSLSSSIYGCIARLVSVATEIVLHVRG
jgi:hypothetical protein